MEILIDQSLIQPLEEYFNQIWPEDMGFSNKTATKKVVGTLIEQCYEIAGHNETVVVLDKLKNLGYEHATRSGMSIGLSV